MNTPTGIVQFGDDFCGVYISGEDARRMAYAIEALKTKDPDLDLSPISDLQQLFFDADRASLKEPTKLKKFSKCLQRNWFFKSQNSKITPSVYSKGEKVKLCDEDIVATITDARYSKKDKVWEYKICIEQKNSRQFLTVDEFDIRKLDISGSKKDVS